MIFLLELQARFVIKTDLFNKEENCCFSLTTVISKSSKQSDAVEEIYSKHFGRSFSMKSQHIITKFTSSSHTIFQNTDTVLDKGPCAAIKLLEFVREK